MKRTIMLFSFSLLFFISSCSYSDKKNVVDTINIFPVDSLSTFIGLPIFINYYDDKLFVVEAFGSERFIKVIDVVNDSLIFSFVDRGSGPNECLSVASLDIYDDDNHGTVVGIYDLSSRIYQVYSYTELLEMKHLTEPILRKRFPDSRYGSFIRLDSMYLATNLGGGKRFILYDDSLNNGKPVCDYRPKPSAEIPDALHALLHNGRTFVSPDRKKIGSVIFLAPLLSVFTVEKQNVQPAWDYVIEEMNYTVRGNDYKINTPTGYLSGAFSEKYVYGLFCGKKEGESDYGDELDVFSYDGELLRKYHLAQPAFGISIDEVNNKLYVLVHEPEPTILIYHIDDI